mmetsp:Transcript_11799/g.47627  ORF Transcript_11799/g.47627 Transcript_11799/m.47627 type:complete len:275 (+) Transcript_11799:303-1127(+)
MYKSSPCRPLASSGFLPPIQPLSLSHIHTQSLCLRGRVTLAGRSVATRDDLAVERVLCLLLGLLKGPEVGDGLLLAEGKELLLRDGRRPLLAYFAEERSEENVLVEGVHALDERVLSGRHIPCSLLAAEHGLGAVVHEERIADHLGIARRWRCVCHEQNRRSDHELSPLSSPVAIPPQSLGEVGEPVTGDIWQRPRGRCEILLPLKESLLCLLLENEVVIIDVGEVLHLSPFLGQFVAKYRRGVLVERMLRLKVLCEVPPRVLPLLSLLPRLCS